MGGQSRSTRLDQRKCESVRSWRNWSIGVRVAPAVDHVSTAWRQRSAHHGWTKSGLVPEFGWIDDMNDRDTWTVVATGTSQYWNLFGQLENGAAK